MTFWRILIPRGHEHMCGLGSSPKLSINIQDSVARTPNSELISAVVADLHWALWWNTLNKVNDLWEEKRMGSQGMRLNWNANLSAGPTIQVPYYQRPLPYSPNKVGTIVKQDFEWCATTGKEKAKEGICSKVLKLAVLDTPWGQAFIHSYGAGPWSMCWRLSFRHYRLPKSDTKYYNSLGQQKSNKYPVLWQGTVHVK